MSGTRLDPLAEETHRFLTESEQRVDPDWLYQRLHAEEPVHRSAQGMWLVSRYAEAEVVMRDGRFSRAAAAREEYRFLTDGDDEARQAGACMLANMLSADPPDLTRMRRLARGPFLPRAVQRWEEYTIGVVDELLDTLEIDGRMDLKAAFGMALPQRIICRILGVPYEDHERWEHWTEELVRMNRAGLDQDGLQRAREAMVAFTGYFRELIEHRRQSEGADDLISQLIRSEEEGEQLSAEELVGNLILLVAAGHETTANLISNGVFLLMREREHWERVVADPSLVAPMLEEVLRLQGPIRFLIPRAPLEDVELGGVTIPALERVIVLIHAANRDPDVFDRPLEFDMSRDPNLHLSFGSGSHFCLGSHLARLEARVAFSRLVERFPDLQLAVPPEDIELAESHPIHAWKTMPVRVSA